jgi:glycolate oxidase FAD binding subunit
VPRNELRTLNLPIADELARRAGIRPRVRPEECAAYAIAGETPKLVFSPRTAAEAAKTIALLAQEGANINIRGAGTKQWRPPAPRGLDAVLDATRCNGIVEHIPADLTVTVAAGTPFADVQAALRQHMQFLAIDPPFGAEATIGGVFSARSTGALRQLYGSPRDQVLGMRVCLADGSIAFTGAKVVKSVAGYDIPKLFVGALGTLGFIAELTLKVAPLPPEQLTVIATFDRIDDAVVAANAIGSSSLFPMGTALLDGGSATAVRALSDFLSETVVLAVRCGGSRGAVKAIVDGVTQKCHAAGASAAEVLDADRTVAAWSDIADLAGGAAYPASHWLVCKLVCLPSDVGEAVARARRSGEEIRLTAHPTAGVVFVHIDVRAGNPLTPLATLEHACADRGWTLEYLAAPPELAQPLYQPVSAGAPLLLQRSVKAALDPAGIFDPGRLAGGI